MQEKSNCKPEEHIMSNDPQFEHMNPPAPVVCEYCGSPRYTKGFRLSNKVFWMPTGPEQCTCQEAAAVYEKQKAEKQAAEEAERKAEADRVFKARIEKIIGESGMGERFLRRTFGTLETTEHNQNAVKAAKRYVESFSDLLPNREKPEIGKNGLFITGPAGTGKTHLAAAIANQLIQRGTPVICMTLIDMLERIKRTFNREGVDEGVVLMLYKTVPLLVIDDMGKEPPTEWAISTIYNIINGRYEGYMPTIVTTNYDDKALIDRMTPRSTQDSITAEATVDRLREMCRSVILTGPSWRQR